MSVCLFIEPWLVFTHSTPCMCNNLILLSVPCMHVLYATDTAQVMTPAHTGTACNQPMQVHMYYTQDLVFRHNRPCVQVLLHATRYQSLLLLCSDWPVLCLLSPHCLSSSLSSDVTSTNSYDLSFGRAGWGEDLVRCVYRTIRVHALQSLSYVIE